MVDEVVAGERVDEVAIAAQVRGRRSPRAGGRGSSRPLPPARATRSSPSGAKSAAATRIIGSSLVRDASTIVGDRRGVTDHELVDQLLGVGGGHGGIVEGGADTSLTPAVDAPERARGVVHFRRVADLGARPARGHARRPARAGAGREDVRAPGAPCARSRCARAHRSARRRPVGRRASTPGATRCSRRSPRLRRALGDPSVIVRQRRRLHARRRARPRSTRSRCCATRSRRRGCSTPATTAAAADLSASTLAMYRGDLLHGAGDGEWVDAAPGAARRGPHEARRDPASPRGCGSATPAT